MKAKINNKKIIVALALLFGISFGLMATFAFSRNSSIFNNRFDLAEWKTVFTEEFKSPSNWTTCETVEKTITVKNESNIDAAVRIKIDEQWLKSDGTTELPLVSATSGKQMAIINFTENSGWEKSLDGYYYYDVDLRENEETTSLTTSVTLNCDANLGVDADYAAATYHLKFTAQTIQYDQKSAWRATLYDVVANQTRGTDENIEFNTFPDGISPYPGYRPGSGKGVFTVASSATGTFPVHYYRGDVKNNHVIFADKCWHIMRTTDTGGVKLIYDSEITMDGDNKTCDEYGARLNGRDYQFYDGDSRDLAASSYMYGKENSTSQYRTWLKNDTTVLNFANDVRYDGENYTLVDVKTGTAQQIKEDILNDHHYFCLDNSATTCSEVGYAWLKYKSFTDDKGFGVYYLPITGFSNMDAKMEAIFANEVDSAIKRTLDTWYEEKILAHASMLEDTVFCNNKTLIESGLVSKDQRIENADFELESRLWARISDASMSPTLECRKDDAYTVEESSNGNGALKYPIGLMTADEAVYAGIAGDYSSCRGGYDACKKNYLMINGSTNQMTMSVMEYTNPTLYRTIINGYNGTLYYQYGMSSSAVQPVVSLKPGTYYKSGDGTAGNPIIVE